MEKKNLHPFNNKNINAVQCNYTHTQDNNNELLQNDKQRDAINYENTKKNYFFVLLRSLVLSCASAFSVYLKKSLFFLIHSFTLLFYYYLLKEKRRIRWTVRGEEDTDRDETKERVHCCNNNSCLRI